ncbi:hypothetical protein [Pseudomonas sp. PONIH3]|jgi:hypothetical protein|uniref:hypothetical protein n=1 Tax=Pseudomonas sp. PONIH3 TaxID=1636610 RepID=UPI000CDBC3D2|nr:hypothetical protein [Pseudomonas sp. PONIH3]AUY35049.1 hypothetical protein C3F42_18325 [Pseudomonas sp. PONIH3]
MHRIMLAATAAAFLTACTSTPVDPETAKAVPAQRLFSHQAQVQPGARLVVTRDAGYWASGGCMAKVVIDGRKAARMDTGEVATFWVTPGRHFVGIDGDDQGSGLCAMQMGQQLKEITAEVGAGETQRFRITGQNGVDIRPSSI